MLLDLSALPLPAATLHLLVALVCGAVIGSEREFRQRLAGLRTTALVSVGSASFVIFGALFPDEVSPTRVAAQVVSGIGFLGAGVIFRDGLNVQGLTTAATLWCAAAVGLLAGAGAYDLAAVLTVIVVFVNLALRPLAQVMKRLSRGDGAQARNVAVTVTCAAGAEAQARLLLVRTLGTGGLRLAEVSAAPADGGQVDLGAVVYADADAETMIEAAVHRLAAEPGLARVRWQAQAGG